MLLSERTARLMRFSAGPGINYFDRDHAATVEASSMPHRIAWGEDEQDVRHISLDKTGPTTISPANP
jgi:hypothetical protein